MTFPWPETRVRLAALWKDHDLAVDPLRRRLVTGQDPPRLAFTLPLVQPLPPDAKSARDVLDALPDDLGLHAVVLVRAGQSALGLWRDDELLAHKVFRRYVVRGTGRAQPLHLKTKGKSRYGSRLRLQNYQRQLQETNRRLLDWRAEYGAPRLVLLSCPPRLLADLRRADPPFPEAPAPVRLPFHTGDPDFDELLRARRRAGRGEIVRR